MRRSIKLSNVGIVLVAVITALTLICAGVAQAAPPDPHAFNYSTLSTIELSGMPSTLITAAPEEDVTISANWSDGNSGCPSCIDYVATAFAGQAQAGCIENEGFYGESGSGTVDLGPAPDTAGTYDVVALAEESFVCGEAWSAAGSPGYTVIAQLRVLKLPSGPTGPIGSEGAIGPEGAPGATGPQGVTGTSGSEGPAGVGATGGTGAAGQEGAHGPTGATGAQGAVQLITCERTKGHHSQITQTCKTSPSSFPVKFAMTGRKLAAFLSRGKVTFATGFALGGASMRLVLSPRRTIVKGSYTLMLKHDGRQTRQMIMIE